MKPMEAMKPMEPMKRWKRMKPYAQSTAMIALLVLGGCASIVSRNDYPVAIDSAPSGVSFYVTDSTGAQVHSGTTPSSVRLRTKGGYFKSQAYTIHLERPGMPTKEYALRSGIDGWYWGNLLLGGLIGMLIVDPLTGAMFKLPPQVLVPLDGAASRGDAETELRIASVESLTPKQREKLIALDELNAAR